MVLDAIKSTVTCSGLPHIKECTLVAPPTQMERYWTLMWDYIPMDSIARPLAGCTYLTVNDGISPCIAPPRVTSFQCTSSATHFTLSCNSTDSPVTSVTWVKDGTNLTIDGTLYQPIQTETHRRYSVCTNTLVSTGNLDSMVGNHIRIVSNSFGSSSQSIVIAGMHVQCCLQSGIVYSFWLVDAYWHRM